MKPLPQDLPEEWRPIAGYDGFYSVSSLGRVRSEDRLVPFNTRWGTATTKRIRSRILVLDYDAQGYPRVMLAKNSENQQEKVHLLVLKAFRGPRPEGQEGCHNNGDPRDARLANLRWDTRAGNHADKKLHGTALFGEAHPSAKLTNADVAAIRSSKLTAYKLSFIYGISKSHARRVQTGERWGHQ